MATPDITDTADSTSTTTGFNSDSTSFVTSTANTNTSYPITLAAVRIPGQFALSTAPNFNFLSDQLGQIRNLQLGLLETDRGTGEFVQLVHKAYLEVDCDFTKFINFNASSTTDDNDDAYQLTGFTLTNDPTVTENSPNASPPVRRLIKDTEYRLDIRPALAANEGAPLTETDSGPPVRATYTIENEVLSSYWFPVGAVLIDLGSATGPAGDIPPTNRSVTVGAASGSDNATYQVDVDKTLAGMTLFGQVIITCSNENGTPMLSAKATFDPTDSTDGEGSGAIILGGGGDSEITVTLLSQDDYTKAQKVVFTNTQSGDTDTLVDNAGSNAIQLSNSAHPLQPGPNDPDDFTITLTLAELGGSQDANTIGRSMISAIKGSVNANPRLLQAFTITATQIDFSTASEFSGYLRSLAANATVEAARDPLMPILSGEKFIIQTPATIDLAITPFQYTFDSRGGGGGGAGPTTPVTQFKLLDAMEVYAVLKHTPQSETPVLKTDVTAEASATEQEPLTSTFHY